MCVRVRVCERGGGGGDGRRREREGGASDRATEREREREGGGEKKESKDLVSTVSSPTPQLLLSLQPLELQ